MPNTNNSTNGISSSGNTSGSGKPISPDQTLGQLLRGRPNLGSFLNNNQGANVNFNNMTVRDLGRFLHDHPDFLSTHPELAQFLHNNPGVANAVFRGHSPGSNS
ncbi:MAG: hypothetical protein A3B68_07290 [Candidatus Melainabacteria bacterium RIFCSPHIGHO2_02_FULL_34_12]|nr:MAG: hypothetical protein A3B68_07290 [Candidatus Melainabacteria bacterium RIFCSPHIGHO2_02_FULL_34_12]